tara:strand:- start:37 stop:222 length:186 start_codon:yes stop_codon:yes gene_type:complete
VLIPGIKAIHPMAYAVKARIVCGATDLLNNIEKHLLWCITNIIKPTEMKNEKFFIPDFSFA